MAVQAQYPSNILSDITHRPNQGLAMENAGFFAPFSFPHHAQNHQGLLHSIVQPSNNAQPISTVAFIPQSGLDMSHVFGPRKRARLSMDLLSARRPSLPLGDQIQQNPINTPILQQSTGLVSTGLSLGVDGEDANVSISSSPILESSMTVLSSLCEDFSTQLQQEQEELNQFITAQNEQFRKALAERRQTHLRSLLAAIENSVRRCLKEKEAELQKVQRKNHELEEQAKSLSMEAHLWQSKAKNTESMVAKLRTNLQIAQSREQSKEGCGDSEADDAVSANHDSNVNWQTRAVNDQNIKDVPIRRCRACKVKEVSILVLPCLHLCLCKSCEGSINICPLCHSTKNASVEVYMS